MGKQDKAKIIMNFSSILLLNCNTCQYQVCIQQLQRGSPQGIKGSICSLETCCQIKMCIVAQHTVHCDAVSCSKCIFQQNRSFKYEACGLTSYLNYYTCNVYHIQWFHSLLVSNISVSVPVYTYQHKFSHIFTCVRIYSPKNAMRHKQYKRCEMTNAKHTEGDYDKFIIYFYNVNW